MNALKEYNIRECSANLNCWL